MADGTSGLAPLADAIGTLHTEQVVSAGDQRRDDLALEAHGAVAAALPAGARRGGGGRGGGGRGVAGDTW